MANEAFRVMISLMLVLSLWVLASIPASATPFKASGNFYIQYFGGRVDPARLPRVYEVFERLRNVADKQANRWPELLIIRDLPGYQVLALPDGHIIISQAAIELIYQDVSQAIGDTRLAFMLGHELAHLSEDDFWDQELAQSLVGMPRREHLSQLLGVSKTRHQQLRKETKADDKGLLFAALAGYPVGHLIKEHNQKDFLSNWVAMTQAGNDSEHAPPEARAKLLQQRLQQKIQRVEQFQFAVRLAHFGRCDDALQIFEELQTLFPGRALFNNMGFCRLQQALASMPQEVANLYWLPRVLDAQSYLSQLVPARKQLTLRGSHLGPLSKTYLDKAEKALLAATQMDPFYKAAGLNLASVQFLNGEVYQARASIEKALKNYPQDPDIRSLKLLILYEEGLEFDMSVKVIELMQKLLQQHPQHAMTRFNLARILSQRGRHAKAKQHWQKLVNHQNFPPDIRYAICTQQLHDSQPENPELSDDCQKLAHSRIKTREKTGANPPGKALSQQRTKKSAYPWSLPIPIGLDILNADDKELAIIQQMQQFQFRLAGMIGSTGTIYSNDDFAILDFDQLIEMVVLKQPKVASLEALKQQVGSPHWIHQIAGGEIWTYPGWAAWSQNGQLKEVWIGQELNP